MVTKEEKIRLNPCLSMKLLLFSACPALLEVLTDRAGVETGSHSRQKEYRYHCFQAQFMSFSWVITSQLDIRLSPISKALEWLHLTSLSNFIIAFLGEDLPSYSFCHIASPTSKLHCVYRKCYKYYECKSIIYSCALVGEIIIFIYLPFSGFSSLYHWNTYFVFFS